MKCCRFLNYDTDLVARSFFSNSGLPYVLSDVDCEDKSEIEAIREYQLDLGLIMDEFRPSFDVCKSFKMDDGRALSIVFPANVETLMFFCRGMDSRETFLMFKGGRGSIDHVIRKIEEVIKSRRFFIGYQLLLSDIQEIGELAELLIILDDQEGIIAMSEPGCETKVEALFRDLVSGLESDVREDSVTDDTKHLSASWLDNSTDMISYFAQRWS